VIPGLRRIVENGGVLGFFRCGLDDLLEGEIGELRAGDQFVQRVDIGLVMLAVMKTEGIRRDYGLQRTLLVRQRRQGNGGR